MQVYTANYSHTDSNFVFQNLRDESVTDSFTPAICVLKNLLQRGNPTPLSQYLLQTLSVKNVPKKFFALIDYDVPVWVRTIRGDERSGYYPAKKFLEEIIPHYLSDYSFIAALLLPEAEITAMLLHSETETFTRQQVDFYLPQAFLVIEIDGSQHREAVQQRLDRQRDAFLSEHGIQVVRLTVADLQAKNVGFQQAMVAIHKRCREFDKELRPYRIATTKPTQEQQTSYTAAAIMRFQLLVLNLLRNGQLNLTDERWTFNLLERDVTNFAEAALEDLLIWLDHLLRLQAPKQPDTTHLFTTNFTPKPAYTINRVVDSYSFPVNEGINIDFSLHKRWTDEADAYPTVIFVRTDYIDRYPVVENEQLLSKPINHFQLSTTEPIQYELVANEAHTMLLNFFLRNVFGHAGFRSGQLGIVVNALNRCPTIGLLPTGSGKSICYQLPTLLQPAISFVVCPIKALMRDQTQDLHEAGVVHVNYINSEQSSAEKAQVQRQFGAGRYFFVLVSPERFQSQTFRDALTEITARHQIAYAVIDEAHCLSEWGHDFRTSYLNLTRTIRSKCPGASLLGLTATASLNVLKDLQIEMAVDDEGVKTLADYGRDELHFAVIDDKGKKEDVLIQHLQEKQASHKSADYNGNTPWSGLVFTPHVNGSYGCYSVANQLTTQLGQLVEWYAGSVPTQKDVKTKQKKPIMLLQDFDEHKQRVQDGFKKDNFALMTATKAFGMGINKSNIRFTAHYGLPASMEALYQEAGRAGRDKGEAHCLVLLTQEIYAELVDEILAKNTFLERINEILDSLDYDRTYDLFAQLFLLTNGLGTVETDVNWLMAVAKTLYGQIGAGRCLVTTRKESESIATEKAIYRLMLLGLVTDWTVDWKSSTGGNTYTVYMASEWTADSCRDALLTHIRKYKGDFDFNELLNDYPNYLTGLQGSTLYMTALTVWTYTNIVANRKQSLKTVYENCLDVVKGRKDAAAFKRTLEAYFKFDKVSYLFQSIAEQSLGTLQLQHVQQWFYSFYLFEAPGPPPRQLIPTDETEWSESTFVTTGKLTDMQSQLSRVLETRGNNAGLNLISGMLRALNDNYDDNDGRARLEETLTTLYKTRNDLLPAVWKGFERVGIHIQNTMTRYELIQSILRTVPEQQHQREKWAYALDLPQLVVSAYRSQLQKLKRLNRQFYEQATGV